MRTYGPKIEKETLAEYPLCSIRGNIYVIDEAAKVDWAVGELRKVGIIGFDTETRPSFVKGFRYKIALLQLSTMNACFLFRLQMIGKNETLKTLIEDPQVMKIGLSTHDDARMLQSWMQCKPAGFIDIQLLVKHFGIEDLSLQKIYALVFGERISKAQQLSNWEAVPLSPAQQLYAATDAWTCMRLYERFKEDDCDYVTEAVGEMMRNRTGVYAPAKKRVPKQPQPAPQRGQERRRGKRMLALQNGTEQIQSAAAPSAKQTATETAAPSKPKRRWWYHRKKKKTSIQTAKQ